MLINIHARGQTLLVGKLHRVVQQADAQMRMCHANIGPHKKARCSLILQTNIVSWHAGCAVYILHGNGLMAMIQFS